MHQVERVTVGVWCCWACMALAVDGEALAREYYEETGEIASAEEMAQGVASMLAEDAGNPIKRIDLFSTRQVLLMEGQPCPHNADLAGIPEGPPQIIWGGGVN